MIAAQLVPVTAAYTLAVTSPDGEGYMLSLLLLSDGRVVSLDPSDHDALYASMDAFGADGRSRGWALGDLVAEPELLAAHADGYEVDRDAVAIGGGHGTR